MVSAALTVSANIYEMVTYQQSWNWYAIRSYTVLFGLAVILAELEWPSHVLVYMRFLELWSTKGLFVAYVGVLTIDTESNSLILKLTGWLMIGLGLLYFLLGIACVKMYRDHLRHRKPAAAAATTTNSTTNANNGTLDVEDSPLVDAAEAKLEPAAPSDGPTWLDPKKDTSPPPAKGSPRF